MDVRNIAKVYWRLIKAGRRTFSYVPDEVKDDVKSWAKADVDAGAIKPEQYKDFIGEEYVM